MDTPAKTHDKPILLNLADKLLEAQREVDELTLQLALGKAEARDKYEEVKKEFRSHLGTIKKLLLERQLNEVFKEIIAQIDQLEARLNVGKVDNREMFVAQRKLIMKSLQTFENEARKILPEHLDKQHFAHAIETFKLKMEILLLKYDLKRFTIKDEIKSNAQAVRLRISIMIDKARKRIQTSEKKLIHINKDIIKAIHIFW